MVSYDEDQRSRLKCKTRWCARSTQSTETRTLMILHAIVATAVYLDQRRVFLVYRAPVQGVSLSASHSFLEFDSSPLQAYSNKAQNPEWTQETMRNTSPPAMKSFTILTLPSITVRHAMIPIRINPSQPLININCYSQMVSINLYKCAYPRAVQLPRAGNMGSDELAGRRRR